MTKSVIRTLLSRITGVGAYSRDDTHTNLTSVAAHSSNSVGTTPDQSLPATSIIHESFAGYDIPPYPDTVRIDEASFEYMMQGDAFKRDLRKGGEEQLNAWGCTFEPGGLIEALHPGWFSSEAGAEEKWAHRLPRITGRSTACWKEIPGRRARSGPGRPYNGPLGTLYVQDDEDVKVAAQFEFDDGCPADAWTRLQEGITSRAEITKAASEAPKPRKWYKPRRR